jgi:urease accessory protein UreF
MTNQPTVAQQVVEGFLGDVEPLARQIGTADGLVALGGGAAGAGPRVTDLPSLRGFLEDYRSRILVPIEVPAICKAHGYASRYELRELLLLDGQLAAEPLLLTFATASQRVGKTQLKRLRPLRDQRLVQRYLRAVQAGEAHGWHTLVYGLILSLYSLPLRQGLLSYARQTTRGFIHSAAGTLGLSGAQCDALTEEVTVCLPDAVNAVLKTTLTSPMLIG